MIQTLTLTLLVCLLDNDAPAYQASGETRFKYGVNGHF